MGLHNNEVWHEELRSGYGITGYFISRDSWWEHAVTGDLYADWNRYVHSVKQETDFFHTWWPSHQELDFPHIQLYTTLLPSPSNTAFTDRRTCAMKTYSQSSCWTWADAGWPNSAQTNLITRLHVLGKDWWRSTLRILSGTVQHRALANILKKHNLNLELDIKHAGRGQGNSFKRGLKTLVHFQRIFQTLVL